MGVGRQPVKGNVEEGIVVARLVGDGDVQAQPVVQEGVRRVPVIIAEIPAGVLAQHDHKGRPEQDGQAQEQPFLWRKRAWRGTAAAWSEAEPDLGWRKVLTRRQARRKAERSAASPEDAG